MTGLEKLSRQGQGDTPAEQTTNAPLFQPLVDIYETDDALVVMADMPGVAPEDVHIDLEDDILRLRGEAKGMDGGEALVREYLAGTYLRRFQLTEAIDREHISAEMNNGELKLVLPKAAKAMPRRIEVTAG